MASRYHPEPARKAEHLPVPANLFRSSNAGAGVWKSTDEGSTWTHLGLTGTNTIARIIVHPTNPDIVWVAAGGNEWTANSDRGIYKSMDGGRNWEAVETGITASITAGQVLPDGRLLLCSQAGDLLLSDDEGAHFRRLPLKQAASCTGVAVTGDAVVLTGPRGVRVERGMPF